MTSKTRTQGHSWCYRRLATLGWLYAAAAAAAIVVLVFTLWLSGVQIADDGMRPTLWAGDVVIFDRLSQHVATPARGDAYAYKAEGRTVVGRVIGLPGETVCAENGRLYVNGAALDESRYRAGNTPDMQGVTLLEGEFLILPDDRAAGLAAREFVVHFDALTGRAAMRVAPIGRACIFTANQ